MNDTDHTDGIAEYYERCRREAAAAWEALKRARDEGADRETIERLERRLELAEYTGD